MARRRSRRGVCALAGNRRSALARLWQAVSAPWRDASPASAIIEPLEQRQLLTSGPIVINEIMYNTSRGEPGAPGFIAENAAQEWIELYNSGSTPVNLNGWRFNQGVSYAFGDVTINPGAYLVVAANVTAFTTAHPSVTNVVGGWTGHLSNSGEDMELENQLGQRDDFVPYSDQGDWAPRRRGPAFFTDTAYFRGWEWMSDADGNGKSLELVNPAMDNECGQNWKASVALGGTPGAPNDVASSDIAPLITDVKQTPVIPGPTDPVTVTARLTDELASGMTAAVHWRLDGAPGFSTLPMYDDGLHGDDRAGDGVFGAIIPAQAHNTYVASQANSPVVEFYISVTDAGGKTRTCPAPTDDLGTQGANLLYQVRDPAETPYTGAQAIYRFIVTNAEWNAWNSLMAHSGTIYTGRTGVSGVFSDAAMNVTLVLERPKLASDPNPRDTEVRYQCELRNRGAGTRTANPHNLQLGIPNDNPLDGRTAFSLNTRTVQAQAAGNAVVAMAGLPSHWGAAVQVRIDGANLAHAVPDGSTDSYQYGSYYMFEPYNAEWADEHMPDDPDGNIYKGVWNMWNHGLPDDANLVYLGATFARYQWENGTYPSPGPYSKQTNSAASDWSDLIHLTDVLTNMAATPDSAYVAAVNQVINVDEWLRYIGTLMLLNCGETTIATGTGDDYSIYRGEIDQRFQILAHDLDTVLGEGDTKPASNSSIFQATAIPAMSKLLNSPTFRARYFEILKELVNTTFSPAQINPLLDQVLGGWVPQATIDAMKQKAAERVTAVLAQIPNTTIAAGDLTADATWTAAAGPYYVSGSLNIPSGRTLTIQPGTVIYMASGANLTVANGGRLLAQGSDEQRILFTRTAGTTNNWGGIAIAGGPTSPETRIAYTHFEYNSNTAISSTNGTLFLDHLTFGNTAVQYLSLDTSSFVVQDCIFPAPTASFEPVHGKDGIKAGGRAIFLRNYWGPTMGYNDSVDFTGGQRPGPIIQFIDNVFAGASDDNIDLDNTDAWIQGNIFMHVHKNGSPDTSGGVSGGSDTGVPSDVTIIDNIFYDVDHVAMAKQGDFFTLINNTIVHQNHTGGLDTEGAVICMQDNDMAEGLGMYLEGNIIYDIEKLVRNQVSSTVTFTNNLMPVTWSGPGTGNSIGNPLFVHVPQMAETAFTSWAAAQIMREWLSLQPTSPAKAAGPNGTDKGGVVPLGVSISGEPVGTTNQTSATLTIGVNRTAGIPAGWPNGSGYTHYRWRLDGGAWSGEIPLSTPLTLTGLGIGAHSVDVIGKNDAGFYQNDPAFGSDAVITHSRRWIVNSVLTPPTVVLNEVLARNITFDHNGAKPDMIELYNPGPGTADLSGMVVAKDANAPLDERFTFPANTLLGEGQYQILYADEQIVPGEWHLPFVLRGEGGTVLLYKSDGVTLADSVSYGTQAEDLSIGRRADGTWGLTRPTFGSANVPVSLGDASKVKINEWLADEQILFANDFVELYNTDALPVDISGYYLTDNPTDLPHMAQYAPAEAAAYRIAPLSFIAANGYRSFTADGDLSQGADHANFKLDKLLGMIGLLDPSRRLVDQVLYLPQIVDVSQGRTPLGASSLAYETIPTPNAENTGITRGIVGNVTTIPIFNIVSATQQWSYWDLGSTPSGSWTAQTYTESGWKTGGLAVFWNKSSDSYPETKRTQVAVQTSGNTGKPFQTYYFRTHFNYTGNPALVTSLELRTILDDGAVIYLNGVPALSIYMPAGTPSYTTLSTRTVGTATYEDYSIDLTKLPAGTLKQGDNVLAVEVHQCSNQTGSSPSSDIAWGTTLTARIDSTSTVILRQVDIPANVQNLMSSLRVSEVMYDPIGSSDNEYIELQNTGATALELGGVRLGGGIDFIFPAYSLAAGEYVVVAANLAAFHASYPAVTNVVGDYTGRLSNGGDNIVLRLPDPYEAAMLRFDYKPSWYPSTAGQGRSLVIVSASAPRDTWSSKSSWRASMSAGGSPGTLDLGANTGTLVINEVMPRTDDATGGQWIELHNTTASDLNIGGWYLSDEQGNLGKFKFPQGTIIPANDYLTVHQFTIAGDALGGFDDPANANALRTFHFDPTGGAVYLTSRLDGDPSTYRESVAFNAADLDVSFGRYVKSDGQAAFVAMSAPTPRTDNATPRVGPIVINELMYHEPAGLTEFVELYNTTDSDVDISQWTLSAGFTFVFADNSIIPAHGYALVSRIPPTDFQASYAGIPPYAPIFGPYVGGLSNAGEKVSLRKPVSLDPPPSPMAYVLVDSVTYGDSAPWPTSADGSGPALIRINPTLFGDDVINWMASAYGGSPGRPNLDSTRPTASIDAPVTLDALTITFSEPVVGLKISDLSLTRNGGANLLSDQVPSTPDGGTHWILPGLRGLTFRAGNYSLTLRSGGTAIVDLAGNPLSGGASRDFAVASTGLTGSIGNDTWAMSVSGSELIIAEKLSDGPTSTYRVPLDAVSSFVFSGGSGDDTLSIDSSLSFAPVFAGGSGDDHLDIHAGTYNYSSDLAADTEFLSLSVASAVVNLGASQHLRDLAIGAGGRLNLLENGTRFIRTSGLSITDDGTLDLLDNDLIVQSSGTSRKDMLDTIRTLIDRARNTRNPERTKYWFGTGITSTKAQDEVLAGLAAVINERTSSTGDPVELQNPFDDEPVNRNCILVKYTWNGDMDVNGLINADDYYQIDSGFLTFVRTAAEDGYRWGDLDYNQFINADDYYLIDSAFLGQKGQMLSSPAAPLTATAAPTAKNAGEGKKVFKHAVQRPRKRASRSAADMRKA